MKFSLYFRGSCGSKYRGHEYSLSIQDISKNSIKDNKWINADDAKKDYYYFHRKSPLGVRPSQNVKSLWGEGIKKLRMTWKSKTFYTESSINPSTCTPILKIKLLKNLHEYNGHEFEGLSKFCSCTDECLTIPIPIPINPRTTLANQSEYSFKKTKYESFYVDIDTLCSRAPSKTSKPVGPKPVGIANP